VTPRDFARPPAAGAAEDGGDPGDRGARAAEALASLRADGVVHIGPAAKDEGFGAPALVVRARAVGDAGPGVRFVLGRAADWDGERVYFARVDGVDATFANTVARVAPILGALEVAPR
jgi:hypothetical protein